MRYAIGFILGYGLVVKNETLLFIAVALFIVKNVAEFFKGRDRENG